MTVTQPKLQAPFPYFGGKSRIASQVWERLGKVRNFVDPFFGSGAILLCRPEPFEGTETVNDIEAALGPEDIGDEPDTDVEPPDGHEIDGISDPD